MTTEEKRAYRAGRIAGMLHLRNLLFREGYGTTIADQAIAAARYNDNRLREHEEAP